MMFLSIPSNYMKGEKCKFFFAFHYMPLALASWRKEFCNGLSFVIKSSFLVSFFLVFVTLCVGCKTQSQSKMHGASNE